MRRLLTIATAAMSLLLAGCATTIRSDVTTFHQWPDQLPEKTYVFEAPMPQDDTLELRSYQNLVRGELARLGFQDVSGGASPAMQVSMRFMTTDIPVRVYQPVYSHFDYYWMPRSAFMMRPYRRGYGYWRGAYSPFYDPFWYGTPAFYESIQHNYRRELQVAIKARDGKRLFDVTVQNLSREMSTPAIMPALVHSAFVEFPGVSGVARRVELKQENR